MAKGSSKAGGGPNSRQNKSVGVRTGQPARQMSHKGVSQIGSNLGNHAMDSHRTLRGGVESMRGPQKPNQPLGNEVALNVGKGGPGTGRTVHACGSQQGVSAQGSPAPGRSFDD
jgi:hypothetical protein